MFAADRSAVEISEISVRYQADDQPVDQSQTAINPKSLQAMRRDAACSRSGSEPRRCIER
jgi:hypothetical protein